MKAQREKDSTMRIHGKETITSQLEMTLFSTLKDGDRKVHMELKSLPFLPAFLPGVQFL